MLYYCYQKKWIFTLAMVNESTLLTITDLTEFMEQNLISEHEKENCRYCILRFLICIYVFLTVN